MARGLVGARAIEPSALIVGFVMTLSPDELLILGPASPSASAAENTAEVTCTDLRGVTTSLSFAGGVVLSGSLFCTVTLNTVNTPLVGYLMPTTEDGIIAAGLLATSMRLPAPAVTTTQAGTPPNTTTGTVIFGNNAGTPVPLQVDGSGVLTASLHYGEAVTLNDVPGGHPLPVAYDSGAAPASGMWRGYAISAAAGAVEVNGVVLGTATGAGQAFAFTLFVNYNSTAVLSNCTVVGGGISL